eukprot:544238-Amphidinium_carterae.1
MSMTSPQKGQMISTDCTGRRSLCLITMANKHESVARPSSSTGGASSQVQEVGSPSNAKCAA